MFRPPHISARMEGIQLPLARALSHSFSGCEVRGAQGSPPEESMAPKAAGGDSPMKAAEQALADLALSAVYHWRSATPRSLTRVFRATLGCLISSEILSFHPSAFCHCRLSEASALPSAHWVVGPGRWLEKEPPFLQKAPTSRQLQQLQPAGDFSLRVGSTRWAECFSPGLRKVRTAVYRISKHTDHTARLAHQNPLISKILGEKGEKTFLHELKSISSD